MFVGMLILLFSTLATGVYSPQSYGEKNFEEYHGSRELIYRVDGLSGKVIFEEGETFGRYWSSVTQSDLYDFSIFFSKELTPSLSCPQSELSKMYDYLQFSNRVLALSYLYENLNARSMISARLDYPKTCSINWKKILNSCSPKSKDMKFFVKNAKHISKGIRKFRASSSESLKRAQSLWLSELGSRKLSDEAQYRLANDCSKGECLSIDISMKKLDKACAEDITLFNKVCSELDMIYGLNYVKESYSLLVNSDILDIADDSGYAAGCLRSFKEISKEKEVSYSALRMIFPITYQNMKRRKVRYLQGSLFPGGSMKKFTEMGLDNLFEEDEKQSIEVVKAKIEEKVKVVKEDKIEFIDRFMKKKKINKKSIIRKIRKKKEEKIRKSSFLAAVELQKEFDSDRIVVDMVKFQYDFLFSIKLREALDESLKVYISRVGLSDMKKNDGLGTRDGPMPLIFLKYLIETNKHQALFNLLNIVGAEFYVKNDIDKAKVAPYNYVQLANDESTNYIWQIYIKKVPLDKTSNDLKR